MTHAHADLTSDLERQLRVLREQIRHADRLVTVGRLAAGVAHELGTPLNIIAGHAQMIASAEVGQAAAVESAKIIDLQVGRISQLLRQLLDFSRRSTSRGGVVEVLSATTSTTSLLASFAVKHAIRLRVTGHAVNAAMDAHSLGQVLANLIVNAIHASPSGGDVDIAIAPVVARSTTGSEGAFARIDIRDSGTGMADEVAENIFEPFFTTKASGEGTGLGLSVVASIVEDHGGWIDVDTAVQRGTTFSVFVPAATDAA